MLVSDVHIVPSFASPVLLATDTLLPFMDSHLPNSSTDSFPSDTSPPSLLVIILLTTMEIVHRLSAILMLGITQLHWNAIGHPYVGYIMIAATGFVLFIRFIVLFDSHRDTFL